MKISLSPSVRKPAKEKAGWLLAIAFAFAAGIVLAATHPDSSVISFDEGFHGGGAFAVREYLLYLVHYPVLSIAPKYLVREFFNGLALYPPLWAATGGLASLVFGASVVVFRAVTTGCYILTLLLVYWAVKKVTRSIVAGLVCLAILATVPLVMIYSNLMMLEVPLLLGVTYMALTFYLYSFDLLPRTPLVVILLTIGFGLASLTKIAAFDLALGITVGSAIILSTLFYRQKIYRRFWKWELILFLLTAYASLHAYIVWGAHYFHIDMTNFYQSQSKGGSTDPFWLYSLKLAWSNREFYFRDFRHMPLLSLTWVGSLVVYALWRRTPFAVFLLTWACGTYIAFSAVLPQVPQYLMPIYAPLAIATGLMVVGLGEWLFARKRQYRMALTVLLTAWIVIVQIHDMPYSETYDWRAKQTGVEAAAAYLASHANRYDRVITWQDGATLAVRLAAFNQEVQLENGASQICPDAMRDSYMWALSVNEPPLLSAEDQQVLNSPPWEVVGRYGSDNSTVLYRNTAAVWPLNLEVENRDNGKERVSDPLASGGAAYRLTGKGEQPELWGCYRPLHPGQLEVTYDLKAVSIPSNLPDNTGIMRLEYAEYQGNIYAHREVTAGELRKNQGTYQPYALRFSLAKLDAQGEFRIFMYHPAEVWVDRITARSL
ncbi:phospholipid carrier-dependent glycosyltransferase [Patescibacteria group bacterium]|nr:phospholipid carrier-dependent glycosyltransferase [Patescibacteria group bacterium]